MRDSREVRVRIARRVLEGQQLTQIRRAIAAELGERETDPEITRIVKSVQAGMAEALRPGRYATHTGRTAMPIGKRKRV